MNNPIKTRLCIIGNPSRRAPLEDQTVPDQTFGKRQIDGLVTFPGTTLARRNQVTLLSILHSHASHLLVVSLKFAVHQLDCPHFGQPKVTSLLFDREIHQVLPLRGNKPGGDGNVANGHITSSQQRRIDCGFEVTVVKAVRFIALVLLGFQSKINVILQSNLHRHWAVLWRESTMGQKL